MSPFCPVSTLSLLLDRLCSIASPKCGFGSIGGLNICQSTHFQTSWNNSSGGLCCINFQQHVDAFTTNIVMKNIKNIFGICLKWAAVSLLVLIPQVIQVRCVKDLISGFGGCVIIRSSERRQVTWILQQQFGHNLFLLIVFLFKSDLFYFSALDIMALPWTV